MKSTTVVTNTHALSKAADLIGRLGDKPSKNSILQAIAAGITGPGHDWGFIKNAPGGVFIQNGLQDPRVSPAAPKAANAAKASPQEPSKDVRGWVWAPDAHGSVINMIGAFYPSIQEAIYHAEKNGINFDPAVADFPIHPIERLKIKAEFRPEAWFNDYAHEVDAEGESEWLVLPADIEHDRNDTDYLQSSTNAPKWVQDWHGPFEIYLDIEVKEDGDENGELECADQPAQKPAPRTLSLTSDNTVWTPRADGYLFFKDLEAALKYAEAVNIDANANPDLYPIYSAKRCVITATFRPTGMIIDTVVEGDGPTQWEVLHDEIDVYAFDNDYLVTSKNSPEWLEDWEDDFEIVLEVQPRKSARPINRAKGKETSVPKTERYVWTRDAGDQHDFMGGAFFKTAQAARKAIRAYREEYKIPDDDFALYSLNDLRVTADFVPLTKVDGKHDRVPAKGPVEWEVLPSEIRCYKKNNSYLKRSVNSPEWVRNYGDAYEIHLSIELRRAKAR